MREIKFRAWNKNTNSIVYGTPIFYKDGSFTLYEIKESKSVGYGVINCGRCKNICQYTGLHDKNDKEIYEGDIVAIDCFVDNSYYESWDINYPATERYDFQFRCSVIWVEETGGFGLEVEMCNLCKKARDEYDEDIKNEMAEIRSGYFEWNELEVVGNIYENPELLEEQS